MGEDRDHEATLEVIRARKQSSSKDAIAASARPRFEAGDAASQCSAQDACKDDASDSLEDQLTAPVRRTQGDHKPMVGERWLTFVSAWESTFVRFPRGRFWTDEDEIQGLLPDL